MLGVGLSTGIGKKKIERWGEEDPVDFKEKSELF
jgi:hypothetical protein